MAPFTTHGVGLFAAGTFQSLRVKIIASTWHLFIEDFTRVSLSTFLFNSVTEPPPARFPFFGYRRFLFPEHSLGSVKWCQVWRKRASSVE